MARPLSCQGSRLLPAEPPLERPEPLESGRTRTTPDVGEGDRLAGLGAFGHKRLDAVDECVRVVEHQVFDKVEQEELIARWWLAQSRSQVGPGRFRICPNQMMEPAVLGVRQRELQILDAVARRRSVVVLAHCRGLPGVTPSRLPVREEKLLRLGLVRCRQVLPERRDVVVIQSDIPCRR